MAKIAFHESATLLVLSFKLSVIRAAWPTGPACVPIELSGGSIGLVFCSMLFAFGRVWRFSDDTCVNPDWCVRVSGESYDQ